MKRRDELCASLNAIVGEANASAAIEDRVCYGIDATGIRALPAVVVRPRDAGEVSRILLLANERRIPVYPRGAGSGMTGGAVALRGGICLEMTRMNRILAIDRTNLTATVEAGVVLADLQAAVERKGLFYPPDPASSDFCTIGGNLAECAGGLRCVKYGVTRDYLLSAEAVLPTGEIIQTGTATMKSVVGYDLARLLVGSEGTLCVFTRATVRLLPLPQSVRTLMAYFDGIGPAIQAATEIVAGGIVPRTLEIMDETTIRCILNYKPFSIPPGTRALLLAESDGAETSARAEIQGMARVCESSGAASVDVTEDRAEANIMWEFRRAASSALYALSPGKMNEDVCVPRSRLAELFKGVGEIASRRKLTIACFGHAGDGNIHVNILYNVDDAAERAGAEEAVGDLFRLVLDLGGSISGEHGIGISKSKFLSWEIGQQEIRLMRQIKNLLDPNNILNPDKIFIDSSTANSPGATSNLDYPSDGGKQFQHHRKTNHGFTQIK